MKRDPLDKILNIDFSKNLKWSNRRKRGGGFYLKKKQIRKILDLISGEDLINMLKDVLTEEEKYFLSGKIGESFKKMNEIYNSKGNKKIKRDFLLKFKLAKLSIRKARKFGFKISSSIWKEKSKFKKLGRPNLSKDMVQDIKEHLEALSEVASNRMIKINKQDISVRYLNTSFSEAYRSFKRKNELSFSTFYSYIGKQYKKPHRLTDLCEYCELGKKTKKELFNSAKNLNFKCNHQYYEILKSDSLNFSLNLIKKFFNDFFDEEIRKSSLEKIRTIELIQYHYQISRRQRESYKNMLNDKNLFNSAILIEMDYKQKILIGMSPRQVSGEFYNQQTRNLIGII